MGETVKMATEEKPHKKSEDEIARQIFRVATKLTERGTQAKEAIRATNDLDNRLSAEGHDNIRRYAELNQRVRDYDPDSNRTVSEHNRSVVADTSGRSMNARIAETVEPLGHHDDSSISIQVGQARAPHRGNVAVMERNLVDGELEPTYDVRDTSTRYSREDEAEAGKRVSEAVHYRQNPTAYEDELVHESARILGGMRGELVAREKAYQDPEELPKAA